MKKLLIGAFVVAAAIAFSVPTASAGDFRTNAGPWCIDFQPNFCDQLEISTDAAGNTWGLWDWFCTGSRSNTTSAIGQARGATFGTRPVYPGTSTAFFVSTVFRFNVGNMTTNLWGTDGHTPPFSFQGDIPFNFVVGPCPWGPRPEGGATRNLVSQ